MPKVLVLLENDTILSSLYRLCISQFTRGVTADYIFFNSLSEWSGFPSDYEIVVCCGLSIDDSSILTINDVFSSCAANIYALSCNIQTTNLGLFDHVFVRTTREYDSIVNVVAPQNVTLLADTCFSIAYEKNLVKTNKVRVALCLASLSPELLTRLQALNKQYPFIEYHVLNFAEPFIIKNLPFHRHDDVKSAVDMLRFMSRFIDIAICGTYSSVVFASIGRTRLISLLSDELLLPGLGSVGPESIDITRPIYYNPPSAKFSLIPQIIFNERKDKIIQKPTYNQTLDETYELCKLHLPSYMQISSKQYDEALYAHRKFNTLPHAPIDFARFVCYLVSNKINHSCIWGLSENFTRDDFCLYEAIHDVWNSTYNVSNVLDYFPVLNNFTRRAIINVDPYIHSDFLQYHRSGWAYAVDGLMNLDAKLLARNTPLILDTYVDRSFHWGADVLKNIDRIPYKQPWIGFVHHTFDTTHSSFNCEKLFENMDFLQSLHTCKGLLVFSDDLAHKIRDKLAGYDNVKVYVLDHPTELVDNNFTFDKFMNNPNKKVVQVGAWLRNPYAIYELELGANVLGLGKAALKGKEMDMYFPPSQYIQTVKDVLLSKWDGHTQQIPGEYVPVVCRTSGDINKYCSGVYDMLEKQWGSVEVIERLDNKDYDELFSQNIIFLNLVDCAAVNTVVECIVRNTVIVLNRLPALIEMLGEGYPGFYDNLVEASAILNDPSRLINIYNYLCRMNKDRFRLETFVNRLQDIIINIDNASYVQSPRNIDMPIMNKRIHRFLPEKLARLIKKI